MESKIGKAIKIMRMAIDKYTISRHQNARAYKIMNWTCKRYGFIGLEGHKFQLDVLNGFIKDNG